MDAKIVDPKCFVNGWAEASELRWPPGEFPTNILVGHRVYRRDSLGYDYATDQLKYMVYLATDRSGDTLRVVND